MNLDLMTGGDLSALKQRLSEVPTTPNSPNEFSVSITRPPKPATNPPIGAPMKNLPNEIHPGLPTSMEGAQESQIQQQKENIQTSAARIEAAAIKMETSMQEMKQLMNELPENVQEILHSRLGREVLNADRLMSDVRRRHMQESELEIESLRVALKQARAELDEKPRRATFQTFLTVMNVITLIGVLAAVIILILT